MELKLTNETALYRQIREGSIKPCYFFYGKDIATLESVVKRLVAKLVPRDARDLNYHFFPADEMSISELADVCASLPMFSERVVAAVNDFNADTAKAADMKQMKSIIGDIDPETTTVIFYATGDDLCKGKKKLTKANLDFAAYIVEKGGVAVEFAYKKPRELVKYISARVEKGGASITDAAALSLAQTCLCNVLMINNEIDKLCAYREGECINEEDVALMAAGQIDADAYKLAKAIALRNSADSFALLSELFNRQQEPVPLLGVIGSAFLDLYRAKLALMSGRGERDISGDFDYRNRGFAVTNALRDCSGMSVGRLRSCLRVISDCDADLKSKRTDDRVLLETAVTRLLNE